MRRKKKLPKAVSKNYADYIRLGMKPHEAIKWAWFLSKRVKDHWRTPRCGW